MNAKKYLETLQRQLLKKNNWKRVVLTRAWASLTPDVAGVYAFQEKGKLVYVGETGNLQGRMEDLLDSRHHTVRRTLGHKYFSTIDGYIKATTKTKFPGHIELLLNSYITKNLYVATLEVKLGRKELEELLESEIEIEGKLNKRGKRKIKKGVTNGTTNIGLPK